MTGPHPEPVEPAPADPAPAHPDRWSWICRLAPYALLFLLSADFLDLVPSGDARIYYDWAHDAVTAPFDIYRFACNDHPSVAYLLWIGLPQYIWPCSTHALHLADVALVCLGIWAFQDLLNLLFGAVAGPRERMLMATLFAVNPALIGCTSSSSPDLGMAMFLMLFLRALLRGRKVQAGLFGVCLIFTKETAIAFYPFLVTAYLVLFVTRSRRSPREALRGLVANAHLGAPVVLLAIYVAWKVLVRTAPAFYAATELKGGTGLFLFLNLNLNDRMFQSALMEIFGASFNWMMSLFVLGLVLRAIYRYVFDVEWTPEPGDPRPRAFITAALVLGVYVFTRAVPYTNPRYVIPVLPLFLLVAFRGLTSLVGSARFRCAWLGLCIVLGVVSCHATIDPVSRAFWGTFQFGSRPLLSICTRTREPGGPGQDQLLYNLECLDLPRLTDDLLGWIKPDASTVIVGPSRFFTHLVRGPLDSRTFARTLDEDGGITPEFASPDMLLNHPPLPQEIFTIDYPNMLERRLFPGLIARYDVVEEHVASRRGHELIARRLRLRPLSPRPSTGP